MGLVALCGWAALLSMHTKGLSGDTAAWVQAAGSTAAIGGAIWLSNIELRRQRHQRRQEREEVAWSLRFSISLARTEATIIAQEVADDDEGKKKENIRYWILRCKNARKLIQNYASNPNHIHPAFAQAGNNGLLLCEAMETDIEALTPLLRAGRHPTRAQLDRIASYPENFDLLLEQIDDRMNVVSSALDRGDDMLPIRTESGWFRRAKALRT